MTSATPHPIGTRIRELRLERRLSQEQLAAAADVTIRTIWNVENGIVCLPRNRTRQAIATALGIPVAELDQVAWDHVHTERAS